MNRTIFFIMIISSQALAFVSGPSSVNEGENYVSMTIQNERGKIEPNENKSSYQSAQIDINKLKYVRGFEGGFGFSRSNLYIELTQHNSAEEKVGSTLFYEKDQGSSMTIGFSGDLVHDLEKQLGVYFQLSPLRNYNENKFSNPRLDTYSFGITSAFNVTDNLFQKNLIHYGSGDGSDQNSYLAVDTGFGYRLNHLVQRQMTIFTSLFLEADTTERKDSRYDDAFSPAGTQDRIRAFKYGTVIGVDVAVTQEMNLSITQLQKLGGYDARATRIFTASIGLKF